METWFAQRSAISAQFVQSAVIPVSIWLDQDREPVVPRDAGPVYHQAVSSSIVDHLLV